MVVDKVIDPGTLKALPGGFAIGVRIPWYRALPISTIDVMSVNVDGNDISLNDISFETAGKSWSIPEMANATDDFWYVLDTATLKVSGHELAEGSEHMVEVTIGVRPPYIKGLRNIGSAAKQMKVA